MTAGIDTSRPYQPKLGGKKDGRMLKESHLKMNHLYAAYRLFTPVLFLFCFVFCHLSLHFFIVHSTFLSVRKIMLRDLTDTVLCYFPEKSLSSSD